jgi:hypothetical protein
MYICLTSELYTDIACVLSKLHAADGGVYMTQVPHASTGAGRQDMKQK